MATVDIGIVILFVLYAIFSGLHSRKAASADLEAYFLAGRSLSGWRAGISMAATQFASDTPLLVAGLIATAGLFSLWRLWIYAVAFLMMGFLLAPGWRRAGVLTDAEFTEVRYGGRAAGVLRAFKAVYFGVVFNCTVLAMVLLAAARIAEPFLLWNAWLPPALFDPVVALVRLIGVPITSAVSETAPTQGVWIATANNLISIMAIALVTLFYSTAGGLRSVVNTDLVQFAIAMVGTAVYAGAVAALVMRLGGLERSLAVLYPDGAPAGMSFSQLVAMTPSHAKDATFVFLSVLALQWIVQINADGTGYLAQRTMACRSDREAKKAAVVFSFAQVLFRSFLWIPIGLGLLVLIPVDASMPLEAMKARREFSFVLGMDRFLPPGAKGLMLTGLLAALASTVDTHLNWGSSYLTNDLFKRFAARRLMGREPTGRELVWVARSGNVVIFLIALIIMANMDSIQTAWTTSLLLGSGVGAMLVLRWIWWRVTARGEIAAIAASLLLAPILLTAIPQEDEALRLLLMALGATVAGIGVSIGLGPEKSDRLKAFYGRVRPPGFWGPIAAAFPEPKGASRRTLVRGVGAVAAASMSIFCLLTAGATWLAGSPAPAWFPSRSLWIVTLIVVGIGLTPVWTRLGFKES